MFRWLFFSVLTTHFRSAPISHYPSSIQNDFSIFIFVCFWKWRGEGGDRCNICMLVCLNHIDCLALSRAKRATQGSLPSWKERMCEGASFWLLSWGVPL